MFSFIYIGGAASPCNDGDVWVDECDNRCHCTNGTAACTKKACAPPIQTLPQPDSGSRDESGITCFSL